jgi:mannobiose 2-epimerase
LLEAYTGLVWASDGPRHRERLRALLEIILGPIIDPETGHLILFQDEHWRPLSGVISFGHEIETSWLLCEAADTLADDELSTRARAAALRLADGVMKRGYDAENGGFLYDESPDGRVDTNKEWWGQAEGVVGLLNAFELSGREEFLEAALRTWDFIDAHVIDRVLGEWHNRVTREGEPISGLARVDFWKCPYHNVRAMLEIDERTRRLAAKGRSK